MHELLLFGQIPASRHEQVLSILAGVAAMQPQRMLERHVVYKPLKQPEQPGGSGLPVGGSQTVASEKKATKAQPQSSNDLYYVQTIQHLSEDDFGRGAPDNAGITTGGDTLQPSLDGSSRSNGPSWTLRFHDVPDPSKGSANSRLISSNEITAGDPHKYMQSIGYRFLSEYVLEGYRFVYGNLIILIQRSLRFPASSGPTKEPQTPLPALDSFQLVDPSGAHILQSSVRVQDGGKPALVMHGTSELTRFKTLMKGIVELNPVDRLSMDTRVKYRAPG